MGDAAIAEPATARERVDLQRVRREIEAVAGEPEDLDQVRVFRQSPPGADVDVARLLEDGPEVILIAAVQEQRQRGRSRKIFGDVDQVGLKRSEEDRAAVVVEIDALGEYQLGAVEQGMKARAEVVAERRRATGQHREVELGDGEVGVEDAGEDVGLQLFCQRTKGSSPTNARSKISAAPSSQLPSSVARPTAATTRQRSITGSMAAGSDALRRFSFASTVDPNSPVTVHSPSRRAPQAAAGGRDLEQGIDAERSIGRPAASGQLGGAGAGIGVGVEGDAEHRQGGVDQGFEHRAHDQGIGCVEVDLQLNQVGGVVDGEVVRVAGVAASGTPNRCGRRPSAASALAPRSS